MHVPTIMLPHIVLCSLTLCNMDDMHSLQNTHSGRSHVYKPVYGYTVALHTYTFPVIVLYLIYTKNNNILTAIQV